MDYKPLRRVFTGNGIINHFHNKIDIRMPCAIRDCFARFLVIGPEDEECWGADMRVVDKALLNQVSSGG